MPDDLEKGFEMLAERRRSLGLPPQVTDRDRSRVAEQHELCRAPWAECRAALAGDPDIVAILDDLWPRVVPYLVKGYEVSPVHHIPHVVLFAARIGSAELGPADRKRLITAALLHDIGIGDSILPKISEHSVRNSAGPERERLRRDGIASRLEHMRHGARISASLLEDLRRRRPELLNGDDLDAIVDIVGTHDNAKIPLLEGRADRRWLLGTSSADWVKQCHWEADALWMLCPAGVRVDLLREGADDTAANRAAKLRFNVGLHAEIVTLYAGALDADEMRRLAFRDGLLFRSGAGHELAAGFLRRAEDEFRAGGLRW